MCLTVICDCQERNIRSPMGPWIRSGAGANSIEVMAGTGGGPMTSLVPGLDGPFASFINLGRNNPEGWTTFNGYIGDTFVYLTALTDAQRQQVENIVMAKFPVPTPAPTPVLAPGAILMDPGPGIPSFTFETVAGYQYRMIYTEDLSAAKPVWSAVFSLPDNPGPKGWSPIMFGGPITITDPSAVGRPQRFYRAQAQ